MKLRTRNLSGANRLPAPALSRGLAVLAMLGEGRPASLEEISGRLRLPKASALRFLSTLQALGLLRKNPDKTYEAMFVLRPIVDPAARFLAGLEDLMGRLCQETGCTVEWYEPSASGCTLKRQVHPDCEVRVQARPGFVRKWEPEFEAVIRLGYAFIPGAPAIGRTKRYVTDGQLRNLSKKEVENLLTDARTSRTAIDTAFNNNGVRRAAAAVIPGGIFSGILAIAEVHRFGPENRNPDPLRLLSTTLAPYQI